MGRLCTTDLASEAQAWSCGRACLLDQEEEEQNYHPGRSWSLPHYSRLRGQPGSLGSNGMLCAVRMCAAALSACHANSPCSFMLPAWADRTRRKAVRGHAESAYLVVTGIATFSCHEPGHVLDVVPGDYVAAAVLTAGAALMQVCRSTSVKHYHAWAQQLNVYLYSSQLPDRSARRCCINPSKYWSIHRRNACSAHHYVVSKEACANVGRL